MLDENDELTPEELAVAQELADELGYRVVRTCANFAIEEGLPLDDERTQVFIEAVLQAVIKAMPRGKGPFGVGRPPTGGASA